MIAPPWIIRKHAEKAIRFSEAGIERVWMEEKANRLSRAVRKVSARDNLGYVSVSVQGAKLLIWGNFWFSPDLCFCEHKLLAYKLSEDLAARGQNL